MLVSETEDITLVSQHKTVHVDIAAVSHYKQQLIYTSITEYVRHVRHPCTVTGNICTAAAAGTRRANVCAEVLHHTVGNQH